MRTFLPRSIGCLYSHQSPRLVSPLRILIVLTFLIMEQMVPRFMYFHINMMSKATPFVFLLMRLISILTVFCLPNLGNLLINKGKTFRFSLYFSKDILLSHKDNPFRDNLCFSKDMLLDHKENPSRDNLQPS